MSAGRLLAPLLVIAVAGAAVAVAAALTVDSDEPPLRVAGGGLRLVEVATGLDSPTHVAAAPGEPDRLYVVEQPGRVRVVVDGHVQPEPFLDIVDDVRSGGEQGLLSVAFHPGSAENGLFYVDYTDVNGDTRVVEFRASEAGPPVRTRELLFVEQPAANHNGGQLAFGPDGLLYVGMGDGGGAGDPDANAQNLESPLGKLLRLDVDRPGAEWEIVAYGLRNPWRFSFDRETGDLWIADVGQREVEEIDFLPAGFDGLANFGWDVFEGTRRFEDKEPSGDGVLVEPVAEYGHDEGCSVTGGFVSQSPDVPAAEGRYFYGDYCSGAIWSLALEADGRADARKEPLMVPRLSSFGEDLAGRLYLVSQDGTVYRLSQ